MLTGGIVMDKVCVITGGALGIGKCLVKSFAQAGFRVVFIDCNEEALIATDREMKEQGFQVEGYYGDIGTEEVLNDFARYIASSYGKVAVLINNACISKKGILSKCSYDDFNYVLRVGVAAPYQLACLLQDNFTFDGVILNISSTRAFMSQMDTESYTAAKGGITALTHSLAISLAGKVRVNAIAPGWIDTGFYYEEDYEPNDSNGDINQHPSKRIGRSEDIASLALFLCDEKNSFINGQCITVDGGMSKQMIYHNDYGWKLE